MDSYTVKLNVNLKIGSGETITKGRVFRGPLVELPDYVQELVKEKSRHVVIMIDTPVKEIDISTDLDEVPLVDEVLEIPEVEVVEVVETPVSVVVPKQAPKKVTKKPAQKTQTKLNRSQ